MVRVSSGALSFSFHWTPDTEPSSEMYGEFAGSSHVILYTDETKKSEARRYILPGVTATVAYPHIFEGLWTSRLLSGETDPSHRKSLAFFVSLRGPGSKNLWC